MNAQLQFDFVMELIPALGLHIDPKLNLGLLGEAGRGAGILEGQVFDVLAHDLKMGKRRRSLRAWHCRSTAAHVSIPVNDGARYHAGWHPDKQ
jgi:hypothetical protein